MNFYSLYHINTSFSSIEKKNLKNVINACYWPLLRLAEKNPFKISSDIIFLINEMIFVDSSKRIYKVN